MQELVLSLLTTHVSSYTLHKPQIIIIQLRSEIIKFKGIISFQSVIPNYIKVNDKLKDKKWIFQYITRQNILY